MKIEEHHEANKVVILDLQGKLMIGDGDILLREKVEGLVEGGAPENRPRPCRRSVRR